jgi:hypothetical protein
MSNGVYSGFIPSSSGEAVSPGLFPSCQLFFCNTKLIFRKTTHFILTINNTDPIWFYCPQSDHCQSGMVGVINPYDVSLQIPQYQPLIPHLGPADPT